MKELTKNIILLACVVLLMFIFIEIVLRFFLAPATYPSREIQNSDNKIIQYELKPNLHVIDSGPIYMIEPVTVKTDSNGLREDEEHAFEKEGTFRIALIGDSITFGMYVEQNETYGHVLENLLNEKSETEYETLNFGVPGYNTIQESEVVREKALIYDPDIVLMAFVSNDFNKALNPLSHPLRNVGRHVYSLRLFFWNWVKLKKAIEPGTRAESPTPEQYKMMDDYLKDINTLLKKQNITFILFSFPEYELSNFTVNYNEHLSVFAEKEGFYFFDLLNLFEGIEQETIRVHKEGHPNHVANEIIGLGIYNKLREEGLIDG